jgi:hypothetical protein
VRADRGHSLDFIEAAKRDAARSREILATVLADLNEHNRWFDNYLAEETKKRERHARMLRRNRVTLQRQERHEQRLEAMKGGSLRAAAQTRASVQSFWGGLLAEVTAIKDAAAAGGAWTIGALNEIDDKAFRFVAGGLSWTGTRGSSLAKSGMAAAAVAGAGIARASRSVSGVTARAASAGAAWTSLKGHALAKTSASALSAASARIAEGTHVVADATTRAASTGLAWSESKGGTVAYAGASKLSAIASGVVQKSRTIGIATAHLAATGLARSGAAAQSLAKAGAESFSSGSTWSANAARNATHGIGAGSVTALGWMREKVQVAGTGISGASAIARDRAGALSKSLGPSFAGARDRAGALSKSLGPNFARAREAVSGATKASVVKAREGIVAASGRMSDVAAGSLAKLKNAAPEVHAVVNEAVRGVRDVAQISKARALIEASRQRAVNLASPEQIAATLEVVRRRGESGAETIARWTAGTKAERLGAALLEQVKRMRVEPSPAIEADRKEAGAEAPVEAEKPASRSTALVVYQPELANFPPMPKRTAGRR